MDASVVTEPAAKLVFPGFRIEHGEDRVSLFFDALRPVLSSAVVNGGLTRSDHWLNLKVSGEELQPRETPASTVKSLCRQHGWSDNTVAMMTAASMKSLRIRYQTVDGHVVLIAATSGLANARRVGDRAEYRQLNDSPCQIGTINIAIVADLQLPVATMVEAVMTVTEARAAALQQRGIRSPVSGGLATGTGTDAIAIFSANHGTRGEYAGKHTILGETLGRLALAAVGDSIDRQGPLINTPRDNPEVTDCEPR